jgi:hypothetical protein
MKRVCKLTIGSLGLLFLGVVLAAGDAFAQTAKDLVGTWTLVSAINEQGGNKTDTYGPGSVSKVEMVTLMALIYKVLFSSISTFETLPRYCMQEKVLSPAIPPMATLHRQVEWIVSWTAS